MVLNEWLTQFSTRLTRSLLSREVYLLALYRVFEGALMALLIFAPNDLTKDAVLPMQAKVIPAIYIAISVLLLFISTRPSHKNKRALITQVSIGIAVDIIFAALITHYVPAAASGIAMLLVINIAGAALLVPSLLMAAAIGICASIVLIAEFIWSTLASPGYERPLAEALMFCISFSTVAILSHLVATRIQATRNIADKSTASAASMSEINSLIIRRMRTGVIMIDESGIVTLANEAALLILGEFNENPQKLSSLSPQLHQRLWKWKQTSANDDTPIELGANNHEVVPRFARLLARDDTTLIFLDDTSLVSRRAESLTLATMGRFSASLAHEIRNPLAAISYATQLLEESNAIGSADRRLLNIIHQQCLRTNAIVESVLGIARRERAQPEYLDLVAYIYRFVDEYVQTTPPGQDKITATSKLNTLSALVDPRHLNQVLTILLNNALRYGRIQDQPAKITLHAGRLENDTAIIDVLDRGPGIPESVANQLFKPFFTTSEHGTGLGLYIAHELCRANGLTLEYVPIPGGGACFRISFSNSEALFNGNHNSNERFIQS